jgi:hypothetical protein
MGRVVGYYEYSNDSDPERHKTACRILRRATPYLGFPTFVVRFHDGAERIAVNDQLTPSYDLVPGDEDGIFSKPFG